jgi:Flp pilus assembly protein TadD
MQTVMKPLEVRSCFVVVVGLLLIVYGGTLGYPMVFDDEVYLRGNPIFTRWESFLDLFRDFGGLARRAGEAALDPDLSTNFIMRPVTYFTFFLNHAIGGVSPQGYRFFNVMVHGLNGMLVWGLLRRWLNGADGGNPSGGQTWQWEPLAASAVFVLHPLQIDSVTYVIQRATSLCCFFILLAVLGYQEWRASGGQRWLVVSGFGTVGALFSKETGFVVPVLLLGVERFVLGSAWRGALLRVVPYGLAALVVPALLMAVSAAQGKGEGVESVFGIAHGVQRQGYSWEYAMTEPMVWWRYLRLVMLPTGLNLDPDIPMVAVWTDWRFWVAGVGLMALVLVLWRVWKNGRTWRIAGILVCSGWWWAVALGPDSSVVPLPDVMAEHRTYVSMVGASAVLGLALAWLGRRGVGGRLLALGVTVSLGGLAIARNAVWGTPERLWRDTATKSPGKARPWINLGGACFEAGNLEGAREAFERANSLMPTVPACANLAVVHLRFGDAEAALRVGMQGMALRPSGYDHLLLVQVAAALVRLGREVEAMGVIRECVGLQPRFLPARMFLGALLLKRGLATEAERVFSEGLRWNPGHPELLDGVNRARLTTGEGSKLKLGF